jgi:reverse gyrase
VYRRKNLLIPFFSEDPENESEQLPETNDWVISVSSRRFTFTKPACFEDRSIQVPWLKVFYALFQEETDIVMKRTGTGKIIAYHIPALWRAKKNKKRKVVAATHTITLQAAL